MTVGEILQEVVRVFGYVSEDDLPGAVYVMPNGRIIGTKGPYAAHEHSNVASFISELSGSDDMDGSGNSALMSKIGAIRVTPWIPAAFLGMDMPERQSAALSRILAKLSEEASEDRPLIVSSLDGSNSIYITEPISAYDAETMILRYSLLGILMQ